jgi:hypothetical protein
MFAPTRWSYTAIVYRRILEIAPEYNNIALKHGWETVSSQELKEIALVLECIEPFHAFTNALQQDKNPTISLLLPGIQHLVNRLDGLRLNKYPAELSAEVKTRFNDVLTSGNADSELRYIVASVLDPAVAYLLTETQLNLGVKAVKKLLGDKESDPEIAVVEVQSPFGMGMIPVPARVKPVDSTHEQIQRIVRVAGTKSAAKFWKDEPESQLRQLAIETLMIPATSGAVERLFSLLTMHVEGRKVGIKEELLKARTTLTYNEEYID